ncbi:Cytochrome P450, partial [Penicillium soppii]|uniref:Cytochrome P450 n=1 Tax=Penicillium soppii TaxID=69789 RepID=UPI002546F057
MDPFGITVSALGIAQFAISSIGNLRDFINSLDEAKDMIQDMTSDLEAIQLPLSVLGNLQISDDKTYVLENTGFAEAVSKCGQACADFFKKLEQWTKHFTATNLSPIDRLSVGLWNKEKIRTFRIQVHSCQAMIQFAIDSAQFIILVRSENAFKAARHETEKQQRLLENAVQKHIKLTKRKQDEAFQRQNALKNPEDEDEDDDGGAQRTLAIQEIEEQSRVLESDQTASRAISQMLSKLSASQVANTHIIQFSGSHNHGCQLGHSTGTINWTCGPTEVEHGAYGMGP